MKKLITAVCLLFGCVALYAQTYTIGTRNITWTDAARSNRQVPVEVRYPGTNTTVASDSFPFVVFGHGFQMTGDNYYSVVDSLVKRGYIALLAGTETSLSPSHANFAQDLIFIYNTIITEGHTNSNSPFYGHVVAKGAIGGHSMGGGSTVLSCQYATPATCYFTLSAANTNPSSISAAPSMNKPYLAFAGSRDCIAPPAAHQLPMYDSSNAPCKVYVNILDALHCQFGSGNLQCNFGEGFSGCASSPLSRAAQIDKTLSFLIPYLNYYLKDSCAAWQQFEAIYAANTTDVLKRNCTNTIPANPAVNGNTAICPGGSTTLTAQPSGFTYSWSNGSTTQANSVNTAGSYTVSVSNGVCAVSASATVTQSSGPSAPGPVTMPDTVCAGIANIEIVTPVSLPGEYYLWTLPAGWSIASGDSSNHIYAVAGSTGGAVSVVIQNACGTSQPVTKNVVVVPSNLGTVDSIAGPRLLCSGADATFTINPVQGAVSYIWTTPVGWQGAGATGTSATITAGTNGGTVQVSAVNSCGTSQPATLYVAINNAPVMPSVMGVVDTCGGLPLQLSAPLIGNADGYTWVLPSGWQFLSSPDSASVTVSTTTSGYAEVTAYNGCGNSAPVTIQVSLQNAPVLTGAILGTDTVCQGGGEGIYYTINPMPSVGNVYDWALPAGWSFSSGDSTMSPVINVASSGTLSVVAVNQCGTSSALSYNITMADTPVAQLAISGTTLTATPAGAGYSYQWYYNGQVVSGQTGNTLQATSNGVYMVLVTNLLYCSSTAQVNYVYNGIATPEAGLFIYPNPAGNQLYITDKTGGTGTYTILDTKGRMVLSGTAERENTAVDIPDLATGMYTICLHKSGVTVRKKFVKL